MLGGLFPAVLRAYEEFAKFGVNYKMRHQTGGRWVVLVPLTHFFSIYPFGPSWEHQKTFSRGGGEGRGEKRHLKELG